MERRRGKETTHSAAKEDEGPGHVAGGTDSVN